MSMSPLSSAGFGCVYSVKLRISTSMPCFSLASFTRARCVSFSDTTPMRTVWAPSSPFFSACELQAVRANAPTAARDRPAKERREMFEGVVMGFSLEDGATSPARVGTAGAERCGVGRAVAGSPRGTARRAGARDAPSRRPGSFRTLLLPVPQSPRAPLEGSARSGGGPLLGPLPPVNMGLASGSSWDHVDPPRRGPQPLLLKLGPSLSQRVRSIGQGGDAQRHTAGPGADV